MRATFPDMRKAAPACQDPGRPHVPNTVEDGRNTLTMSGTPGICIPAQRPRGPEHQSWCVNHIADDEDSGTCMSADLVLPGQVVALVHHPDRGVLVNVISGDHMEEIPLDEAEQRALAMLTTALLGRGVTPPATALSVLASAVTS